MQQSSIILIVDDEQYGRDTLEGLLHSRGYELVFARNGPEALAKAEIVTPDVILLDVMMPEMNGFEVCQRIRANPRLAEIPIILLTALGDYDSRLTGIKSGADDFITKPFDAVELRARIHTTTRLNRYRRLKEQRARFEWVVDQADDGYLVVNERDTILYCNATARLYLELPANDEKVSSRSFIETIQLQHYEPQPFEAWTTWPNIPTNELALPRYLVRPETSTAEAFWLQVNIFEGPAKAEAGRIIRLRDVTQQMTLQRDMRGFHASVLHKLRTPLTIATSSLQLLTEHAQQLPLDEIISFSKTAYLGVKRLKHVVNDVLQYMHVPTLVEPEEGFKLSQLPEVVNQLCDSLGLRDITVAELNYPENMQLKLSHQAVELILIEILENAKKFHPNQNPSVEVSVSYAGNEKIILRISDNGLTLSPEQLRKVWTPYYQGEKYFTGEIDGIGLGLSMVSSLVWGVGGRCSIFNCSPGPGVTIELVLPLN
ncbi:MAG: response regulator [Anaerolineae bacterium]|nr:response regulator [Anaerolineae bacterium]